MSRIAHIVRARSAEIICNVKSPFRHDWLVKAYAHEIQKRASEMCEAVLDTGETDTFVKAVMAGVECQQRVHQIAFMNALQTVLDTFKAL